MRVGVFRDKEKVKGEKKRNSAGMRHEAMKVKQNQRSKEKKRGKKRWMGNWESF